MRKIIFSSSLAAMLAISGVALAQPSGGGNSANGTSGAANPGSPAAGDVSGNAMNGSMGGAMPGGAKGSGINTQQNGDTGMSTGATAGPNATNGQNMTKTN
jgi:hypothetical protein